MLISAAHERAARRIVAAVTQYIARNFRASVVRIADDCPICIDRSESVGLRLSCSHTFHLTCISQWLRTHPSCPMCRRVSKDGRSERLARRLRALRAYLALPVESLLGFRGAVGAAVLLRGAVPVPTADEVHRTLREADRHGGLVQAADLAALRDRWHRLRSCRDEIATFDARAAGLEDAAGAADVSECCHDVARRLCGPFDLLYDRVKDRWVEFNALRDEHSPLARELRARLCAIWRLETMVQLLSEEADAQGGARPFSFPAVAMMRPTPSGGRHLRLALSPHPLVPPPTDEGVIDALRAAIWRAADENNDGEEDASLEGHSLIGIP